jgi:putative nucleotidyltransferase with HDIG domain
MQSAVRAAAGLLFVILACFAFPTGGTPVGERYIVGEVQKDDVIAPFDFKILKDDTLLRRERSEAAAAVAPVFDWDGQAARRMTERFVSFSDEVESIREAGDLSSRAKELKLGQLSVQLTDAARDALLAPQGRDDVLRVFSDFLAGLVKTGVLDDRALERAGEPPIVTIRREAAESLFPAQQIPGVEQARVLAKRRGGEAAAELAWQFVEPNLRFNGDETEHLRRQARENVADFEGLVLEGERIVAAHDKITAEHARKLESLNYALAMRQRQAPVWRTQQSLLGRFLVALLLTGAFAAFLRLHRPRIFDDTSMIVLLAFSGAITLAGAALVLGALGLPSYFIPMTAAPILVAMMLDAPLAVFVTLTLALLVGALGGLGVPFILVAALTGFAAILSVRQLSRRRDFYRSILFISAAYVASLGAVALADAGTLHGFLQDSAAGITASFVSVVLVSFILPVIESLFSVTTDVSLLELADLNRPLLRRMMIEAPGTYHHSMVVGQLAEAAADAIGADPLLARVMAYYHDIGKIEKPGYFVENLTLGMKNRHEKLTPTMSCLILESHVKEGIDLAKKERLPQVLVDAIPEHHGTSLMSFFYHKALESDSSIDEQDYRYPGPKPRSKETAILMLADGVEAASRALIEPTPSRIRAVVKRILDARVNEGQLDLCNLTIEELARVRESFVRVLTGIFHGRVQYPQAASFEEPALPRSAAGRVRNGGDIPRKRPEAD